MSHVFISYSRKDVKYKKKLVEHIEGSRFQVWHDDHIEYGDVWWPTIVTAIEECAAFIVIMTPDAEKSEWVRKEILIAKECEKHIFPLWIKGKIFSVFVDTQCVDLRTRVDTDGRTIYKLPSLKFYRRLSKFAPPLPLTEEEKKTVQQRNWLSVSHEPHDKPQYTNIDNSAEIEVARWADYRTPGNNDYYGMTMLALALEAADTFPMHSEAIIHLKRAFKLEPRILDRAYMTQYHEWTDEQQRLIKSIVKDRKFW